MAQEARLTIFEKTYEVNQLTLMPPASGGLEPHRLDKLHHGSDRFVFQGDVTLQNGGLALCGMRSAVWAAPHLWSGVKNVRVNARVRIDQIGDDPQFGVKFGRVWLLDGGGPRIVLKPDVKRILYSGDEGEAPAASECFAVPIGQAFDLEVGYAFDDQRVRVVIDGLQVLDMPLPQEPLEGFMERYGRPAALTGTGLFASDLTATIERLSLWAGAPRRRIAVIGDSNTQRHFWVRALERALGEPVTNLGIGGDCAALCRLRFERDVLPLRPKIVVIYIGTNDLGWGRTPAEIAADIEFMALAARGHGIRPLVGELLARRGWSDIAQVNAFLHAMCARYDMEVLKWHAETKAPDADELKPGYAPDGCHPVRLGGEAMVRAIDMALFKEGP